MGKWPDDKDIGWKSLRLCARMRAGGMPNGNWKSNQEIPHRAGIESGGAGRPGLCDPADGLQLGE